ncbi:amidohydrolase [Lewinella marina]|uniref:N-acyl-L-amino acid amidohydrolase n=1 Tax=Neolewinella marina TaxID=438751 RepID=A0A2G0CHU7_9BACT|nr:amidohydrolase [Neolewinella marina]NJB85346.1 amidohydrolase [Neolewinella marina]PHK99539.1 N-acyl-L-amino acid amidohydrolase [Neolewinella marina]
MRKLFTALLVATCAALTAQAPYARTAAAAQDLEEKVIEWRRHVHQYPELSNREVETGKYIAEHLRKLGMEVRTNVAHTGVVGILKGGKPGGVVALRADIDALPVTERADLPFASKAVGEYRGEQVGVMHACGHDTHVAMLMGAAEILTKQRENIPGTVVFLFQPAEEGAPEGEEGGAELMVKEGVLSDYGVEAAFGIHINSQTPVGHVNYKPGGAMAASNSFSIVVKGKQAHGSAPWSGVDPITAAAQIVTGLQLIVARQTELTKEAAVISIGKIQGGVRSNIIPEEVTLIGTIRTLDEDMKADIFDKIRRTATNIAASSGAEAVVTIDKGYPVTYNDPEMTERMLPTVKATVGEENVHLVNAVTGAEDFSFFAREVPSVFLFLGGMAPEMDRSEAPGHHTPDFVIDERGLIHGVQLYTNLALDYLRGENGK